MRTRAALLGLVLLAAGCASGGGAASHKGPGPSSRDLADPAGALRRAGAADALTPEGARQLFGPPYTQRREGAGAILSWRTPRCALTLVFAADARGALRLDAAEAASRDPFAPAPSLEQCVAEARG